MNPHEFTITRQSRWMDGEQVVEVNQGGLDYANADMLCEKYKGEGETFQGMAKTIEKAIEIAKEWQQDEPDKAIKIGVGCTHGMSIPFEEKPLNEETFEELRKAAASFDESLPKCVQCGEFLGKEKYGLPAIGEYDCCSEYCAEKYYDWTEVED